MRTTQNINKSKVYKTWQDTSFEDQGQDILKLSFDVQVTSSQFDFTNVLFIESVISSRLELASNAEIIMNDELERT
jgi:hypothetical protein